MSLRKNKRSGFSQYLVTELIKLIEKGDLVFFILVPIVLITGVAGLISIIKTKDYKLDSTSFPKEYIMVVVAFGLLLITSFIYGIFKFLNNDKEKKKESFLEILDKYDRLTQQRSIEEGVKETLNKNPDLINIETSVYNKIISNLEGSLINKLDERFKNNIKTEFIISSIINELNPLTTNIEKYIEKVQRNSTVNLLIGILGTITAIIILAFAILNDKTFTDFQSFFMHFLPRFTFVIFIQLFAFFFLRLYKNNLEDAKYFQNELTNLAAKSSAIKISYLMGNEDKVYEVLKELSGIERNFKLFKEETTIGLEKAKLEANLDKTFMDQMKDLLSRYESKK